MIDLAASWSCPKAEADNETKAEFGKNLMKKRKLNDTGRRHDDR